MEAPVLTISEQKAAISGKKKKKKTLKNVLCIPSNLKVESDLVEVQDTEKLRKILERLLPSARLTIQQDTSSISNKEIISDPQLSAETKSRRSQLSLGVNALNRSIKKELISAVLLAADIQPKFLIHHLNLLCSHNKIPYLHMLGLRNITRNSLGFPCIALGFKKNFLDFSEAIEEIKSISETKKIIENVTAHESGIESSSEESDEREIVNENSAAKDETAFTYLFRSSTRERIFVPEKSCQDQKKPETDFIMLGKDDMEMKCKNSQAELGISSNLIRKKKTKLKTLDKFKGSVIDDDDDLDDDETALEVPMKKIKKDWVIDKVGTRKSYYPACLKRVPSNPDRIRKK